jgi:hypothetical protein
MGINDPIPICGVDGHGWKGIQENREATWLCSFRDERSSWCPPKYIFLGAESKIKGDVD